MALNQISALATDLADAAVNFPSSDGVNALSMAQDTAETLTIPSGANLVRLVATADVYMKAGGTATVPGDTTDGTAAELLKYQGGAETWRVLNGVSSLSFITHATGGAVLTASFYKL